MKIGKFEIAVKLNTQVDPWQFIHVWWDKKLIAYWHCKNY